MNTTRAATNGKVFPQKRRQRTEKKQIEHSSATYQLMISGGDVKAVQGTTGHATADMLVNTYAHIQQSSRVELGKKFEEDFYAKQEIPARRLYPPKANRLSL